MTIAGRRTRKVAINGHFRLPIYETAGVYRIENQVIMNNLRTGGRSILVALLLAMTVAIFFLRPTPIRGGALILFAGTTDVSAGSRLGNGSPEFPFFDLAALSITNIPSSGRVGLFVITNGISRDIYFSPQSIEVWQSGRWVTQAPSWGGYGSWLEPGKSCMQPIPEPEGEHPWRIRYGVQEHRRGLMGAIDEAILKTAKTILFPIQPYIIVSPTIFNGHAATNHAGASVHQTQDSMPAPGSGGGR